ncbi:hypothetical protein LAD12857_40300 [Lacrimispora amygdalina]|uniref:FHA domain-containing protein n=1 Tax=Lacrimispora amygdalina TaxID=253257 RepID=A0A3E2N7P3_9FIRM|nr:DUF6382 domain-containing protein [Clostridium indicum]RFZ77023.1 FHA domain-containing protein [Clostridium indicum]
MNVTYRREMKHNYLIIEQDKSWTEGYEINMLKENQINGLLKFHLKQIDSRSYFYYEITSKQPLNRILEFHSLNKEELKGLIAGIAQVLNRLPVYLLKEDQILLQPEFIYLEPDHFLVSLCLVPGRDRKFSEEMTELLRYLLGKVNHQDKECVVMAYALYQESLKDNYSIDTLTELVGSHNTSPAAGQEREERNRQDLTEAGESQSGFTDSEKDNIQVIQDFTQTAQIKASRFVSWRPLIIPPAVMTVAAILFWSIFGYIGIKKYWYIVLAAGILSLLYGIIKSGSKNELKYLVEDSAKSYSDYGEEQEEWQTAFYESKEEPRAPLKSAGGEELIQTVLLTNNQKDIEVHILKSAGPGNQDIAITYTPFLIGKQEGLVDYVLDGEAISRIHVKIEKAGSDYCISDLNSTNGTYVNGRLLETNETVLLNLGDEIFIANFAFIFT